MINKGSDQTVRMPRLIQFFAGPTSLIVGFVMHWLIFLISPRKRHVIVNSHYRHITKAFLMSIQQGTSNENPQICSIKNKKNICQDIPII